MTSSPYRITFEPLFLVLVLIAALAYVWDVRRTPAADRPGRGRIAIFAAGLALIAVPVNSPL